MSKVRPITSARRPETAASLRLEWAGAVVPLPNYVVGEGEPHRPDIAVWMEFPSDLIIAFEMGAPGPGPLLARALVRAMQKPMAGPPRRPDRIRVADEAMAAQVREVASDVEIVVAPTPEIDAAVALMGERAGPSGRTPPPSYLEEGRIPEESVRALFVAARGLWAAAPWKNATHHHLVRVDVPGLDVRGACLSEIGSLGESFGILIFPSIEGYGQYLEHARAAARSRSKEGLGTSVLSLEFDEAAQVPASMRREVEQHGWSLPGKGRYPRVLHRDPDGVVRPLHAKDVAIAGAVAASLASMCIKHPRLFRADLEEPLCESWLDHDDLEVRFTVPYEAGPLFEVNREERGRRPTPREDGRIVPLRPVLSGAAAPSRNDPCSCGSGRKYKKCCMTKDQEHAGAAVPTRESLLEMDAAVARDLVRYVEGRFEDAWESAASAFADDPDDVAALLGPWFLHDFPVDGSTVAEHYVAERGGRLSLAVREHLECERRTWLSVWEVTRADEGQGVLVADLLSGTRVYVTDHASSRSLRHRDAILARVLRQGPAAIFSGSHPRVLPPELAAEVVRRARGRLRRKSEVPADRLRDVAISRYLIRAWDEAVGELDARRFAPPVMQNTDGDPIKPTRDRFTFDARRRAEVEVRLESLEGVEAEPATAGERLFRIVRTGNVVSEALHTTLIGEIVVSTSEVLVETNSVKRANRLRNAVEAACGDLIRRAGRKHDGTMRPPRVGGMRAEEAPVPPEALAELMREYKARHYATWPDHPLPALRGKTPREAVRTREGRERVEVLLKQMENAEARGDAAQAYDFTRLREDLGLGE